MANFGKFFNPLPLEDDYVVYECFHSVAAVDQILSRLENFLMSNHALKIKDSGMKIFLNILGDYNL